ncbi:MAG: endopeptidase La [Bacteroidaceae bacterium]|nr:endopeptidase La [Bacteroidaceae bacterium]
MNDIPNKNPFSFVAAFKGDDSDIYNVPIESELSVLPLRDTVLFPGVIIPIAVGRESSLDLVRRAQNGNIVIATATQRSPETELPFKRDLYEIGVAAVVLRIMELSDGTCTALVQGLTPIHLDEVQTSYHGTIATVTPLKENYYEMDEASFDLLKETLRERLLEYIKLSEDFSDEDITVINTASDLRYFLNYACTNIPLSVEEKIGLLREKSHVNRAAQLLRYISREIQFAQMRNDIKKKTQEDIDYQQRQYFLQQQLHNIQEQLGETTDNDSEKFRARAMLKKWDEEVKKVFYKELQKLERLNTQSPDYQVQYNYLDIMLQLPWGVTTQDKLNLNYAERVLNRDHYGMKEVKERILEHLAVRIMNSHESRSTILCLYGPPGVGKTSLCKSIATALNRKYVRASLGGLHDEAEIRGHRKTYVGAMPGRIIKSLIKVGTSNPVFVLDEIDKITERTLNGDPSSALLEVLDPEQNTAFHDNFLDVDFDLSKVLFIATANNVSQIPRPLLDRMELIEVNGYITEEKIEIARRHLEPRVKENCGLKDRRTIKFTKPALEFLIENYTRESGVRGLEKELDRFYRRMVLHYERHMTFPVEKVKPEDVQQILGKPKYSRDIYQGNKFAGVVTGLAWTSVGGEILFIESSLSRGKGQKLTLTGNLGDVMKESAMLAMEFIKAHAEELGVDLRIFDNYNIHIHVPEGAVPKDGPSAGITMATSLASALTQRRVRDHLAMTGEITLRGKVLPVGGIKEKILAAKRAGITDIILCQDNRKDIEEIDDLYLRGLTFHYVETILDVLHYALLQELIPHPMQFTFDEEKKE